MYRKGRGGGGDRLVTGCRGAGRVKGPNQERGPRDRGQGRGPRASDALLPAARGENFVTHVANRIRKMRTERRCKIYPRGYPWVVLFSI